MHDRYHSSAAIAAGLFVTASFSLTAHAEQAPFELISDDSNYQYIWTEGGAGGPGVNQNTALGGTYLAGSVDQAGISTPHNRIIYQFDISQMQVEAEHADFSAYYHNHSGLDINQSAQLYGSTDNLNQPINIDVDEAIAIDQAEDTSHHTALDLGFVGSDDEEGQRYATDITDFLNDRYDEYQDTGNPYVTLRLQGSIDFGEQGDDGAYRFGRAQSDPGERPKLEVTPIPEPGSLALLAAGTSLLALRRRR